MIYMKFYDGKGFRLKKLWMTEDGDDDDKINILIVWICFMKRMEHINLNQLALSSFSIADFKLQKPIYTQRYIG